MKRDDIKALIPDITDEQLNGIMAMNGDAVNAAKARNGELQGQLDAANSRIKELEQSKAASETNAMTLEERIQAMEQARAEEARAYAIKSNTIDAKGILQQAGLTPEQVERVIPLYVSEDKDKTMANINGFVEVMAAQVAAQTEELKRKAMEGAPTPQGGAFQGVPTTRQEFNKLTYEQQLALKQQNPEVVKQLLS